MEQRRLFQPGRTAARPAVPEIRASVGPVSIENVFSSCPRSGFASSLTIKTLSVSGPRASDDPRNNYSIRLPRECDSRSALVCIWLNRGGVELPLYHWGNNQRGFDPSDCFERVERSGHPQSIMASRVLARFSDLKHRRPRPISWVDRSASFPFFRRICPAQRAAIHRTSCGTGSPLPSFSHRPFAVAG